MKAGLLSQIRNGCGLLLLFCCLLEGVSGWPKPNAEINIGEYRNRSKYLLQMVDHTLQKNLTHGFNCTLDEISVKDITDTNTVASCVSHIEKGSDNCKKMQKIPFNMMLCLGNISRDLQIYKAKLDSISESSSEESSLSDLTETIKQLLEATNPTKTTKFPLPSAARSPLSTFENRLTLCQTLQSFRVRIITINRVMNYLTSE